MRDVFAMDEVRAARAGSGIVLAEEEPFRLAGTVVRPASLEVEFQSETVTAEPRVMQVLVALSRGRGEPTSRKRLIECCWAGRRVTQGALNRSIAQLRKVLRDPGIEITTIPRVGYRLRAASAADPPQLPPVAPQDISMVFTSHELEHAEDGGRGGPAALRGAAAGASRGGLGRRGARIAAVVAIALLALAVVVWEWVT
jgi:DNA-binding winged helix-turn-helix (wHTH) protein